MKKGFSLVELLVTVVIIVLVLSVAHLTYIHLLKGFKFGSEEEINELSQLIGLEILRLDLEHIGYGIPINETTLIVETNETDFSKRWDSNVELSIRSTLNNTNKKTRGWIIIEADSSNSAIVSVDEREDKSSSVDISVWRADTKEAVANNNACASPSNDNEKYFRITINNSTNNITSGFNENCLFPTSGKFYYLGFPINTSVSNACNLIYCNKISYKLSKNPSDFCNKNTGNLLRKVGNSKGEPIIECVADWKITADLDTDSDGKADVYDTTLPSNNNSIRAQLKTVSLYLLVQIGKKNPNFTFTQTKNCGTNRCIDDPTVPSNIYLVLPSDYENYKWKVIKLKVKPMNL